MTRVLSDSELESFPALEWAGIAERMSSDRATRSIRSWVAGWQCPLARTMPASGACRRRRPARPAGGRRLLRRDIVGNLVTYVVNRNINFTNVCFVGCKFCAFSRGPREDDTYFHSLEDMAQKAIEAWELGATEVCIQGGLPRGLPPFYYRDILRAVKNAVPGMHIHAFSPMEIVYGVELTGMPLARLS